MYIDLLEDGLDGLQWQLINVKKNKTKQQQQQQQQPTANKYPRI